MKPRKRPTPARIKEELLRQRVVHNLLNHKDRLARLHGEEISDQFDEGYTIGIREALTWVLGETTGSPALRIYGEVKDQALSVLGLRKKDIE